MPILTKNVLITLNPQNVKWYENLGYNIPRRNDKYGYYGFIRGTKIDVLVKDIKKCSHVQITSSCDCCGKIRNQLFKSYRKLCHECAHNTTAFLNKRLGENNPNYDHNKTNEDRVTDYNRQLISGISTWKNKIKRRDNYTCKKCGYIGEQNDGILNSHHLNNFKNFKDQRLDINNGITLCNYCHKLYHLIFGLNSIKEEFEMFQMYKIS